LQSLDQADKIDSVGSARIRQTIWYWKLCKINLDTNWFISSWGDI